MHPDHVYLVRHARAEPDRGGGDAARPLTADGRERFRLLVEALRPRLVVARILTSPYQRARQTAELLAAVTGAPVEDEAALSSGDSGGEELLDLARRVGPGVALVGHNPEIAQAVALAARRGVEVRPGTVAAVVLGPSPALAWVESPESA